MITTLTIKLTMEEFILMQQALIDAGIYSRREAKYYSDDEGSKKTYENRENEYCKLSQILKTSKRIISIEEGN